LEPLSALRSVLAVALVNLRVAARVPAQAGRPAAEVVAPLWAEGLRVGRYQEARPLSVREFTLALGRLGGHLHRAGDGLPGWPTLWQGWNQLHAMSLYELSRRRCGKLGGVSPLIHAPGERVQFLLPSSPVPRRRRAGERGGSSKHPLPRYSGGEGRPDNTSRMMNAALAPCPLCL
jgi:hypothetical protein